MRTRGYFMALGLCGLGLLAPAVARAACTEGNPFTGITDIADATYKFKVVCRGEWSISIASTLNGEELTVQFAASEDNTGKECHATMFTPTGGVDEFQAQQTTCKFTEDQQVKFSYKKKK